MEIDMIAKVPKIMISAISSSSGKTTVTTALLKALSMRELKISAFKSGPDYIDPMFHSEVVKVHSRNLDKFMLGENNCKYLLSKNAQDSDISIIEGAMGYYDGIGLGTSCSSYELSKLLNCPVVLVIKPSGMAVSVAAIIEGFKNFRPNSNINGVILNSISKGMYDYYKNIIESNTDVKVYGYMPYLENCKLESRHLGLVTAQEIEKLEEIVSKLGKQALETIDIDGFSELANNSRDIEYYEPEINYIGKTKIAIAKDKSFCFYYQDSLDVLKDMGAELIEFSPMSDKTLPKGISGLYIGGGYPELYMNELSSNKSMLKDINEKIATGLPTFAECGGYMYLLDGFKKEIDEYNLVGAVKGTSHMTRSLTRFGYVTLTSQNNNLMCHIGDSINGHEFHYSDSTNTGESFIANKPESQRSWSAIIADETKFVGYPHIHFMGNIKFAENFIKKSIAYQKK
jgi:cobyrinic acid a,c-diamide synthase